VSTFKKKPHRRPRYDNRREDAVEINKCKFGSSDRLLATFTGRKVLLRPGETSEQLIRRFKTVVEKSGLMKDIKRKDFHKSNGELRREKALKARKRIKKREKKSVRK